MNYYQKYLKYKDKYIKLKELRGGVLDLDLDLPNEEETLDLDLDLDLPNEEQEKEIAIVCHCHPSNLIKNHPQLSYIDIKDHKIIKNIGVDIKYIDPLCPDDNWDSIIEPLMYIWGINCPIYMSYVDSTSKIQIILENSLNKLKIKGKVLFGFDLSNDISILNQIEKNTAYFTNNPFPGFDFKIVSIEDLSNELSYIIGKKVNKYYFVFTKNEI